MSIKYSKLMHDAKAWKNKNSRQLWKNKKRLTECFDAQHHMQVSFRRFIPVMSFAFFLDLTHKKVWNNM